MNASPRTLRILLAGILVLWALLVWRSAFLIDDAYISMRYARNWAEHGIPAFHLDANPPVEGYSNFLWVVLLRMAGEVGWGLESAAMWLGAVFGLLTVLCLYRFLVNGLDLPPVASLLGTLVLATFPPFTVWSTGGLESTLFAFLALATFAALHGGRGVLAGVAGLALALTRVEGFLWVPAIAVCVALTRPADRARYKPYFLVYLVGFGAFLFWRHHVYGEWVANTVHAKAGFTSERLLRGAKTTASFFLHFPTAILALVAALICLRGPLKSAALSLGTMYFGFLAYDALVGGDWMPFFRFLAPAAPVIGALCALLFARMPAKAAVGLGTVMVVLSLLPLYDKHLAPESTRRALEFREFKQAGFTSEWGRWERSKQNLEQIFLPLGRALKQVTDENDSLTFGAIGAVGFESDLRIHDYNGLVDAEVARQEGTQSGKSAGHDKSVPRSFFLSREPTLYHAVLLMVGTGEDTPVIRNQVRAQASAMIERRVFANPAEEPLRARTWIVVHPLKPEEGLPEGSWIGLLQAR